MIIPFPFPRTLVAVLAVAAVLFGLLAMHSMTLTTSVHLVHSVQSVHSVQAHEHAELANDAGMDIPADAGALNADARMAPLPMPVEGCGGTLDCVMLGMACVMALLTVALTLLLREPVMSNLFGTTALRFTVVARHFTLPRPPSLVALSISRT